LRVSNEAENREPNPIRKEAGETLLHNQKSDRDFYFMEGEK